MVHLTQRELQAYLDGTLSAEARTVAEAHAAECRSCRVELETHRAIARTVRAHTRVEPPFDFTARVMAEIAPPPRAAWFSSLVRNVPAMVLAGAFGMIVIIAAMQGSSGVEQSITVHDYDGIVHTGTQTAHHASHWAIDILHALTEPFGGKLSGTFVLATISIGALLLVDRLVSRVRAQ